VALTAGKFAFYAVEWSVRPAALTKPLSLRVKEGPRYPREARNVSAEESKTDRLR
jgi:hypothetical protein